MHATNQTQTLTLTVEDKIKTVTVLIFIITGLFFWIGSCGDEEPQPTIQKFKKFQTLLESKQFVTARLISPSTADFFTEIEKYITQINDTTFSINNGWVDSQNGFGAMVRSTYSCKIIFLPSIDQVRCEDLVIE